jgi:uncharacterized phage protein gp47/JayE
MPWSTPTLRKVRELVRDDITASLYGAAFIGNNVLRVMADAMAGLCHLTLRYIDWLALQLLPDTAEVEWLDRHGQIWLVNQDGSTGRKLATVASGTVQITSDVAGQTIPAGTQLVGTATTEQGTTVAYETISDVITAAGGGPVNVEARALDPGAVGNLEAGAELALLGGGILGLTVATVVDMGGGVDTESDDDLRTRVLERIRQPPQGGALHDYTRWAKAVYGCTRAWTTGGEQDIGTVTVRVMFDELRADNDGFPLLQDLAAVEGYIDTVRPVAVKDFWVLAPLKQRIEAYINDLTPDTPEIKAAIAVSLEEMLYNYAAPGRTIYASWKYQAISNTPGVISFAMATPLDDVMPTPGHMAVLGDIVYGSPRVIPGITGSTL